MPALTADQRVSYVQAIFETFEATHKVKRMATPSNEYELARKWALRGVPLAVVLQGINETTGKPKRLGACERAVEESITRWGQAMGGLTELPEAEPLEAPQGDPVKVWEER